MNHLSVDAGLRVIFDAMDTPGGAEEADEDEVVNLQVSLADLRGKTDTCCKGSYVYVHIPSQT